MGNAQTARPIKTTMLQCSMTSITLDCTDKDIYDIIDWCEREIGIDAWSFSNNGFPSHVWTFRMPTPEGATLFCLRWQ
jgi:hypothetical protein